MFSPDPNSHLKNRSGITKSEILVIVVITGVIAFALIPAVLAVLEEGTPGKAIPTTPPDESNRVYHPNGMSIVLPPNWKIKSNLDSIDNSLLSNAPQGIGRSKSMIKIQSLDTNLLEKDATSRFAKTEFAGHAAIERIRLVRAGSLDDPPVTEYEMRVMHNERC